MLILFTPWILFIILLITLICLFKKKWLAVFLLITIGVLLNISTKCLPFRLNAVNESDKDKHIGVMSFNMDGMGDNIKERAPKIVEMVCKCNPDVVFLAEFCEQDVLALDTLMRAYYKHSSTDMVNLGSYFYSKFPIGRQRIIEGENGIYCSFSCEVFLKNDTISLFGCHFTSNNYNSNRKYVTPDSVSDFLSAYAYIVNTQKAYNDRIVDAKAVVEKLNRVPYPIIVMGDFNDVSGSSSLNEFAHAGLKDAWWEGGFGYGATIHKPLPYRIDHFMYSHVLNLQKIKVVNSGDLSDHDALYAEFLLPSK